MKAIVLVTGVIAIFSAGFVTGYYRSTDMGARMDTANPTQQAEHSSRVTKIQMPGKTDLLVRHPTPSDAGSRPPLQAQQQNPENKTALSSPALPPYAKTLSIEEQAQWEAQQQELRKEELAGLEAMIQSMETADLPEAEIKQFRELKEARVKAPIDEPQAWNSPPLERTPEEARADFAASLEQTDIPEAERKVLLEIFSQQSEPTDENLPDASPPALPPHQLQN